MDLESPQGMPVIQVEQGVDVGEDGGRSANGWHASRHGDLVSDGDASTFSLSQLKNTNTLEWQGTPDKDKKILFQALKSL